MPCGHAQHAAVESAMESMLQCCAGEESWWVGRVMLYTIIIPLMYICKIIQVYSINMRSTNQENMQLAHWLCLLGYWLRCRVGTHHLRPRKVARIEGTEKPDGKWRTEKHGKTATGKITVHGEPLHPICLPEYHHEPSNHCDIKKINFKLCNQGARFLQHAKVHLAFPDQKRHCSLHQFALITRCHNTKTAPIRDLIFESDFSRGSLYLQTCRLNVPWTNNDKYQLEDNWLHPSSKNENVKWSKLLQTVEPLRPLVPVEGDAQAHLDRKVPRSLCINPAFSGQMCWKDLRWFGWIQTASHCSETASGAPAS